MFRDQLLLAMAQGHALASRTSVSLSGLSEQPYFDRLHCEFRTRVTTHLGECAIIKIPRFRSEREDLIRQAVAERRRLCMLPECSASWTTQEFAVDTDMVKLGVTINLSGAGNVTASLRNNNVGFEARFGSWHSSLRHHVARQAAITIVYRLYGER